MEQSDDKTGLADESAVKQSYDGEAKVAAPIDEFLDGSEDDEKGSNDDNGPHDESAISSSAGTTNRKRRRCRRNRKAGEHHPSSGKRTYKPYSQMSWEERKQSDERETKRANLRREQLIAAGQAMAPYNTTQFLMEQHEPVGPSGEVQSFLNVRDKDSSIAGRSSGSITGESSVADEDDGTEDMFLEKEFSEAYENFHAERLQMMSKDELIREYVQLEAKLERLQHGQPDSAIEETSDTKILVEIRRLKEENLKLFAENDRLRSELGILRASS